MKRNEELIVIILMIILLIPIINIVVIPKQEKDKQIINEIKKNEYSMYINDGYGYKEYKKSEIFPKGYELNIKKCKCENGNGELVEPVEDVISTADGKITVKSNKTIYCTLYFDKIDVSDQLEFYIKEEKENKYTKEKENEVYLNADIEGEEFKEYCITEAENSTDCVWQETEGNKEIVSSYTFANEENGEKKVFAYMRNEGGYEAKAQDTIIYDSEKPEISEFTITGAKGSNSGYSISVNVTGTISYTDTLSGVESYCINNVNEESTCNEWKNATNNKTNIAFALKEGDGANKTLYAFVKDNAGNISTVKQSNALTLDTTSPSISSFTITGSSGSNTGYSRTTAATGVLAYSDTSGSTGVEKYCVSNSSNDVSKCTTWNNATTASISTPITSGDGTGKVVYAFVKDKAGNISAVKQSNALALDTKAPTINANNLTLTSTSYNAMSWSLTGASDDKSNNYASGLDGYYYYGCGTSTSYKSGTTAQASCTGITATWQSNFTIYIKVSDKAGNTTIINKFAPVGGLGTSADPIRVYYIEHLVILSNNSNSGNTYAGKYIQLERNLDFKATASYISSTSTTYGDINRNSKKEGLLTELTTGQGFKPIGYNIDTDTSKSFKGIFDGKKYTISNIYENNTLDDVPRLGLFGYLNGATIKNLTITGEINSTIRAHMGGIAGKTGGTTTIDTCVNSVKINSGAGSHSVGGLIGDGTGTLTIKNSTNKGAISGGNNTAGILGANSGTATITSCTNSGAITNSAGENVGGILGRDDSNTRVTTITSCTNSGTITSTNTDSTVGSYVGGIIGRIAGILTMTGTKNQGAKVSTTYVGSDGNRYVGGLIGEITGSSSTKITNCSNSKPVSGGNRTGGLIGGNYNGGTVIIDRSFNTGAISTTKGGAPRLAGLVGYTLNANSYFLNSYNTGSVNGYRSEGISWNDYSGNSYIVNCYNSGTITSTNVAAGGLASGSTSGNQTPKSYVYIRNSYNRGTVTGKSNSYTIGSFGGQDLMSVSTTYYVSGTTSSNISGVGTAMTLANMKSSTFATTLSNNISGIKLSSINSVLSGYTLCKWAVDSTGYPGLSC